MDNLVETEIAPSHTVTFPQFVRATATAFGERPALTLARPDAPVETISFAEIASRSADLAKGLIARGVGKGSRIGFIFGNGPAFAVILAAIARIGAIAIPISTLIKSNELVRVLRQSDVHGLIVQRAVLGHDFVSRLCDALPGLEGSPDHTLHREDVPFLRWISVSAGELPKSMTPLSELIEEGTGLPDSLLVAIEAEVHPSDQLLEIYTSGSMALPKGVKHLHGPVLARVNQLAYLTNRAQLSQMDMTMPFFWVGGLGLYLLPTWLVGATAVCTEATMANSQFAMGSVLTADDLAKMSQSRPFWALGMSETFGPYAYGNELRAEGYPLCAPLDNIVDGFEVRVADSNDQPVGDGAIGEIQVRGGALTPGLHKMERTRFFTADGYYRTGDRGLVDGKRIHFIGRDGDLIKTAGSNVSPAEVEAEMQQMAGIYSAYVVGVPDKARGQKVVAAVVPRDGAKLDFASIEAELKQRLSSYKVPRAYVEIDRADVPLLHSNKVSRRQLAELLAKRLTDN